ncbi:MAG: endonuclease domain-containing protein [Chloroflexota bacterium]
MPEKDVTVEAGIPVTTIERTIMNLAGRLDDRQLEHLIVDAERSGRLDWGELQRVIEEGNGRKGLRRLRRVAARVDPRAADSVSPLEIDFFSLCQSRDLPLPQVNVLVEGHWADFYWPKAKLVVETDGYAYHKDRASFERDHEVTVALAAAGYTVHRATYRMLKDNPKPILDLLARSLRC